MQAMMLIAKLPKKNYAVLIAVLEADENLTYEETKERIRTYWKASHSAAMRDSRYN